MKWIIVALMLPLVAMQLKAAEPTISLPWQQFEIGPELLMYNYEEPGLMELDGALYGIDARFTRFIPKLREVTVGEGDDAVLTQKEYMLVLRLDARYATGKHDYDGALQDGTPYKISSIDATSYELRGLVGYSSWMHPDSQTIIYSGLGTRFKDDDSSFDPAGYKRESSYLYLPVLVEHTRTRANGRTLGFSFEYDIFLSGEQVSHLALGDSIREIKNSQSSGSGYRFAVAYSGTTASGIAWKIEPFFRYWDIDDSNMVYMRIDNFVVAFLEPENTTREIGVSTRILF
ncbi:MAG: hypothetical protein ACNA71_05885 [Kiritimatiellia bacterium]